MTEIQKKLIELTNKIGSGATPRGGEASYKQEGISLIRSMNVYNNIFNMDGLAKIDQLQADKLKNVIVKENDILLNITGASVCRCTIVPKNILPARVNQHVSIIRPKQEVLNSKYLLYVINSQAYKTALFNLAYTGATREALTKSDIENFKVPTPPLPIQRKIAAILSAYDDLIENNNRRIAILEKMAEELYREWFVRLRFPGHEKVKIVKGVPEGWEVKYLSNYIVFQRGVEPGSDNYLNSEGEDCVPFIRVGDLSKRNSAIFINKKVSKNKYAKKQDILMSFDGTVGIVKYGFEGCFSSGIRKVEFLNRVLPKWYIYQLLTTETIQNTVTQHAIGSTILHASSSIKNFEFIYSNSKILSKYAEVIDPIFEKILNLNEIVEKVSLMKHRLLSRLMSGKINVENLDIHFPESMLDLSGAEGQEEL